MSTLPDTVAEDESTLDPTVVSWTPDRQDLFARDADGSLTHCWRDDRGWHAWQPMDVELRGVPSIASSAVGHLDVFVRGTDDALWHRSYTRGWSEWESLGGELQSSPTAVVRGEGQVEVFGVGADGAVVRLSFDGAWGEWESIGGPDVL